MEIRLTHYRKSGIHLDSVGDRLEPRLAYRNFGSYESFLISHTVQSGAAKQTALRWYQLRDNGSGSPSFYQSGTVTYDKTNWRWVPSIAEDKTGNAAIGYSLSSSTIHPSIYASWWNLEKRTKAAEFLLFRGKLDADWGGWGTYPDMTVDPVDDCTFWYVNEYVGEGQKQGSLSANTRIINFHLPRCK